MTHVIQGLNINLIFVTFVIVFGSSFQFGYNIGVLNQPTKVHTVQIIIFTLANKLTFQPCLNTVSDYVFLL